MTICLACGYVTPGSGTPGGGTGLFCGHCGAGLGHKLCENKHPNPLGAAVQVCATCGSPDLMEGARVLRLHWLPTLLAAAVAVFVWKWLLAHAGPVSDVAGTAALATAAFLLNTTPRHLVSVGRELEVLFLLAWGMGEAMRLLPNRGGFLGAWLRGLPLRALQIGTRLLVRTARLVLMLVRRAVFGGGGGAGGGGRFRSGGTAAAHRDDTAGAGSGPPTR